MIRELLGEDTWPELEQVLKDYARRYGLSEEKFWFSNKETESDRAIEIFQSIPLTLLWSSYERNRKRMSINQGKCHYSIKQVVEILNMENPVHEMQTKSFMEGIKDKFIRDIHEDFSFTNDDLSLIEKETSGLTINQLYLKFGRHD